MKALLLVLIVATSLSACIAPIKPIPPIGCKYSDAVLVWMSDNSCKWYYMNCLRSK